MNHALLTKILTKNQRTVGHPEFRPGDTIRVHVKIKEGDKERLQAFEGTVIAQHNTGMGKTITVLTTPESRYDLQPAYVFAMRLRTMEMLDLPTRSKSTNADWSILPSR